MKDLRVVLVRPHIAGNVGATARVMRNFGVEQLVLVAPEADLHDRQARQMSTHGEAILDTCRVVPELGEAVADCVLVAGTSARRGGRLRGQSAGLPEDVLPRLVESAAHGPVALVFGPETNGLTSAEVSRCHWLIHIPTDAGYAALNLAQAVAICLYELHRASQRPFEAPREASPAPFADQERMLGELRRALEEIHFLHDERADALMHALRHLIGRAGPTPMEVGVLFGLARQIQSFVRGRGRHPQPGLPSPLDGERGEGSPG